MKNIISGALNCAFIACIGNSALAQSTNIKIPREVGSTWEYSIHVDRYEKVGHILDTNSDDLSTYLAYSTRDTVSDFRSEIAILDRSESADSTFFAIQIRKIGTGSIRLETLPYIPSQQHIQKPTIIQSLPEIDTVFKETLSFAKSDHICSALPNARRKTIHNIPPLFPSETFFSSHFLETCATETWNVGVYWKNYNAQDGYDPEDSNSFEIWKDSIGLLYKSFNFRTTSYKTVGTYEQRSIGFVELKLFKGANVDTTEWEKADAKIESVPKNSVKLERTCEGSFYRSNNPFQPAPAYTKPEVSVSALPAGFSFHPDYQPFYQWSGFIAFGAADWSYQIFAVPSHFEWVNTKSSYF